MSYVIREFDPKEDSKYICPHCHRLFKAEEVKVVRYDSWDSPLEIAGECKKCKAVITEEDLVGKCKICGEDLTYLVQRKDSPRVDWFHVEQGICVHCQRSVDNFLDTLVDALLEQEYGPSEEEIENAVIEYLVEEYKHE